MNPTPSPSTPQQTAMRNETEEDAQVERERVDLNLAPPSHPLAGVGRQNSWALLWKWIEDNSFLPVWLPRSMRNPLGGFAISALLEVAAGMLTLLIVTVVPTFSFIGTVHILVVALVALSWGAAPSLLATVVGAAMLEFVVLPRSIGQGIARPIDIIEALVFLAVGAIISVIASNTERARRLAVKDYAEARARELALSETNTRTDEFLSIASHELRSPLTSLKAALQLGQRRLRRTVEQEQPSEAVVSQIEAVQGLLSTAVHQVDRQDRLVGDLLDVSRIRANKLDFRLGRCDLATLVGDTVDEQRLSWPDRTITLSAPTMPIPVDVDSHRIGQVITNFLTNALKYSPPDAPVAVTVQVDEAEARVSVKDRGPGLTAEQQTHIWERFHRVPGIKQQSGSGAGLGLGLHIARTIVEYHQGNVGIESMPKQGSTFWFTLPLARQPED